MLIVSPDTVLVNVPRPVPSLVCGLLIVGLGEVFQHTPLAEIVPPLLLVTLPPDIAAVFEMLDTGEVVTKGRTLHAAVVFENVPAALMQDEL